MPRKEKMPKSKAKRPNIKKGDMVYILTGALRRRTEKDNKDSDTTSEDTPKVKRMGKVLFVNRKTNTALVEGFNIVHRHTRPTQKSTQGGITAKEAPIHISNLALYSESLGAPTRVGHKISIDSDGKKTKTRICVKTGNEI